MHENVWRNNARDTRLGFKFRFPGLFHRGSIDISQFFQTPSTIGEKFRGALGASDFANLCFRTERLESSEYLSSEYAWLSTFVLKWLERFHFRSLNFLYRVSTCLLFSLPRFPFLTLQYKNDTTLPFLLWCRGHKENTDDVCQKRCSFSIWLILRCHWAQESGDLTGVSDRSRRLPIGFPCSAVLFVDKG